MLFIQSLGASIGAMILIFNIRWSSLLTFSLNALGIRRGRLTVGVTGWVECWFWYMIFIT